MRQLIVVTLLACASSAQSLINPADIPAATKALEYHEGEKSLRCDVEPTKPVLNFGLRLQAGYLLEVPLVQYSGTGHTWTTTVRVTPEDAAAYAYTPAEQATLERLRAAALVGTAAQVAERLRALAARLQLEEVVINTWTFDPEARRRSYALLAGAFGLDAARPLDGARP